MEKIAEGFVEPIIASNPNKETESDRLRRATGDDL